MKKDDLKRLSKTELLEMLLEQTTRVETLEKQVATLEKALNDRNIKIANAGSLAEASLQLNKVFEAAELACQQYKENIAQLASRQETVCNRMTTQSKLEAERVVKEAEEKCEQMLSDAKKQSEEMVSKARTESNAYWLELSKKLEEFYKEHETIKSLLSIFPEAKSLISKFPEASH